MIPIIPTNTHVDVPLYSQIADISSAEWKQKGCGVTDVAMIIDFYKPHTTSVDKVLEEAIKDGAYQKNVGWKHDGLAALASKYDMVGRTFDLSKLKRQEAFDQFKNVITEGPAIASIHRGFNPKSSFGHLVVVTGFDDDFIYYNDPGKHDGIRKVSVEDFKKGWKQRLIVIRPIESKKQVAIAL
jgi:uncharacterized protein YvpB